jgi:hypothetical protein
MGRSRRSFRMERMKREAARRARRSIGKWRRGPLPPVPRTPAGSSCLSPGAKEGTSGGECVAGMNEPARRADRIRTDGPRRPPRTVIGVSAMLVRSATRPDPPLDDSWTVCSRAGDRTAVLHPKRPREIWQNATRSGPSHRLASVQDEGGDECRRGEEAKVDGHDHGRVEQLEGFVEVVDPVERA